MHVNDASAPPPVAEEEEENKEMKEEGEMDPGHLGREGGEIGEIDEENPAVGVEDVRLPLTRSFPGPFASYRDSIVHNGAEFYRIAADSFLSFVLVGAWQWPFFLILNFTWRRRATLEAWRAPEFTPPTVEGVHPAAPQNNNKQLTKHSTVFQKLFYPKLFLLFLLDVPVALLVKHFVVVHLAFETHSLCVE
eukprot:GABV01000236.1.p1 GENE.GABV01000236.1~~GABV01000236.1.p1  ORF type:complete len:192 (+),score=60.52 GABV01000236.1:947-1522(+)